MIKEGIEKARETFGALMSPSVERPSAEASVHPSVGVTNLRWPLGPSAPSNLRGKSVPMR
jgi:hypothetical protein